MLCKITGREERLLNCYNKNPIAFLESLENVLSDHTEEQDKRFIETFRQNPERAKECIKKVLAERNEKTRQKGEGAGI